MEATRHSLPIVTGPVIWAVHFTLCYALLSVGCALGWQATAIAGTDPIRLLLALFTAAAVAALAVLSVGSWRRWRLAATGTRVRFSAATALGVNGLSLIAVLWVGLAIGLMPPCQ